MLKLINSIINAKNMKIVCFNFLLLHKKVVIVRPASIAHLKRIEGQEEMLSESFFFNT